MGYWRKNGDAAVPNDQDTLDWLRKKQDGDVFQSKEKNIRNYQFFKKAMALFRLGCENDPNVDMPFDVYRKFITMEAGYVNIYHTEKGIMLEAQSLAFESMNEETFRNVYKAVREVISQRIGSTSEEIDNELQNFY